MSGPWWPTSKQRKFDNCGPLSGGLRLHLLGPVAIVHSGKPVAIAAEKARASYA